MALLYVDPATHEELKRRAKTESKTIIRVLRELLQLDMIAQRSRVAMPETTMPTAAPAAKELTADSMAISGMDATMNMEWQKTKHAAGTECGCIFDDDMEVSAVLNWQLFKSISSGKLAERFLERHPEHREESIKSEGLVAEKG